MQPRSIVFNEVETKDLCTVRYSSTSNKGLLFCGFEVCRDARPSYLYRLLCDYNTLLKMGKQANLNQANAVHYLCIKPCKVTKWSVRTHNRQNFLLFML